MKIVLLGKTGMLGKAFEKRLQGADLTSFSREELDITDFEKVQEVLDELNPDMVINCTGYTAVDKAEEEREKAFLVNGQAVGELAISCDQVGAILIHFSTDYVFKGDEADGYEEGDDCEPVNSYGESKLWGEGLVEEHCERHFIIRTSWLFGPGGANFVDTMLNLAQTHDELKVVSDQVGSPTFTEDLVDFILLNFLNSDMPEFGIYHLAGEGKTSWYDFARRIFELADVDVKVLPISSEEFGRPAKRPAFSVLKNTKLAENLLSWEEGLKKHLKYCLL